MSQSTTILLVDPDPAVVSRLVADVAAQGDSGPDAPEFVAAVDAASAADTMDRHAIDAVVVDLALSEDEATSVVAEVERRFPGMVVVVTVLRADDDNVSRACHLDAAALLVKPYGLSQLQRVLHSPAADAGFSGTSCGVPTALLLSLHCQRAEDGVLHLSCEGSGNRPARRGSIHIEAGQPVHASAGDLVGAEAVHAMLTWHDAEAHWVPGTTHCARTIVGRWEGLLARPLADAKSDDLEDVVAVAHPEVIDKLARLAQTPDVLGAFLLRHAEVIAGRCTTEVDAQLASRALCRLAHVYYDIEAQPSGDTGQEIQAIVGPMRLVLDRVGPRAAGFQVGVLVRQAAPVCKSLRRLLRQIDSAFGRAMRGRGRAARRRAAPDAPVARVA